jgi:hypothetical protein
MEDRQVQAFTDEFRELSVRAVLLTDFTVDFPNGQSQTGDVWFWFVANEGDDSWFAFAVSDTAEDADEIVSGSDEEELKRMAVWIGVPWDVVMRKCPHCEAQRQRDLRNSMSSEHLIDIMDSDLDNLRDLRKEAQFEGHRDALFQRAGVRISQN